MSTTDVYYEFTCTAHRLMVIGFGEYHKGQKIVVKTTDGNFSYFDNEPAFTGRRMTTSPVISKIVADPEPGEEAPPEGKVEPDGEPGDEETTGETGSEGSEDTGGQEEPGEGIGAGVTNATDETPDSTPPVTATGTVEGDPTAAPEIDELELDDDTIRELKKDGIFKVEDLKSKTVEELRQYTGIGLARAKKIEAAVQIYYEQLGGE